MAAENLHRKELHKNVYSGYLWEAELQVILIASLYMFYSPKIFCNQDGLLSQTEKHCDNPSNARYRKLGSMAILGKRTF